MKTRTLFTFFMLALSVLIITGGCATTPEIKEEKEDIKPEVFLQAVKSGDVAEVKRLIEAGADVNAQSNNGYTVLMAASQYGQLEVCKLLIEKGAEVNTGPWDGRTALILASKEGHKEVAQLLIEAGAK